MAPENPRDEEPDQPLDQALEQSFPPSDPPSIFGDTAEERDIPEGEYL